MEQPSRCPVSEKARDLTRPGPLISRHNVRVWLKHKAAEKRSVAQAVTAWPSLILTQASVYEELRRRQPAYPMLG